MRVCVAVPVLLVAACSAGSPSFTQPPVGAFTPGSCRDLAPAVLRLGKDLHTIGGATPSQQQADAIKAAQTQIRTLQANVPAALAPTVQQLVTSVGILRIRRDTNSYDENLAANARTAYGHLVAACTRS